MVKKVFCLRHIEEPKNKKISKIQTHIGMNNQGVIRTSLIPELVQSLTQNNPYELHTYTHPAFKYPTSRSYYTAQLLLHDKNISKNSVLYEKSDEIDKLVANVLNSKAEIVVIIWEHVQMTHIFRGLIGVDVNYNDIANDTYLKLGKEFPLKEKKTINLKDLPLIKRSSDTFLGKNLEVCDYHIEPKDDISYGLTWIIDIHEKKYEVCPNYIIQKSKNHKNRFKVFKYY